MDLSQVVPIGIALLLLTAFVIGMKRRRVEAEEPESAAPVAEPKPVEDERTESAPVVPREITLSAKYEERLHALLKQGGWQGALCQLPQLPAFFTGRRGELARALALLDATEPPRVLAVRGPAGVGRSGFAAALAHVVAERFPGGQLFLDLRGDDPDATPPDVADVMRHVVLSLNPDAPLPRNPGELPAAYLRALKDRRVLLLFGNVSPQPFLELLPPPAGSLLVLTSRDAAEFARIETIALDPLSRPDGRAFLRESSTRMKRENDPHLDLLAELSGHLPVALRINAARLHSNPALPVETHFDALKKAGAFQHPLEAAVSTSFAGLPEDLQRAWRGLAAISDSFDSDAAAAIFDLSGETARERLDALNAAGMLRVVAGGKAMRFDLHDCSRSFARHLPESDADRANLRFAGHCAPLTDPARRPSIERAWRWARAFVQRFQTHAGEDFTLTDLPEPFAAPVRVDEPLYPDALRVLTDFSNAGTRMGHIAWLEAAVSAARALRYRAGEGRALANLGKARAKSGEARLAVACFEESVEIARGDGDRRAEADALGWLGTGWMEAGFPDRATGCFDAQLLIARETGDRTGEVRALEKLGRAKAGAGDFQNAAVAHDEQLRIAREIGDAESEVGALENLGLVWVRLNDHAKAANFHTGQLRVARGMCDRPGESRALGHLGHIELHRGEIDAAIAHYGEQLQLAQQAGDIPGESRAHGSLGVAWARKGGLREAVAHYEEQLRIARETGNRFGEATAHTNIGTALERAGDLAGTAASWEKALAIYEALASPSAASIRRWLDRVREALASASPP